MKAFDDGLTKRLEICADRAGGKKALAVACKISQPQMFRYVKGRATLPVDRLMTIAQAANVHPYWLLVGEGSPDIPPIQSFISVDQILTIDAKSLTDSLTLAEQLDIEYGFKMTPTRKADLVFVLYQAMAYEARIYGESGKFESSKALEVYGYLASIQGELPRKMILNTIEIINKASKNLLPDKEVRTFCNYLNTNVKDFYNHPTLARPYYDRIGYTLEPDTAEYVDGLIKEVRQRNLFREEKLKILDLGCGNGRHLLHFAKDPKIQATGVDNNELSKSVCQSYEAAGKLAKGSFVEGDMFNLPFKDNSFDFVFANYSIFHTPFFADFPYGLNQAMKEICRVLRSKGTIYIHARYGNGFEPFPFYQLHNEGSIRQLCQLHALQLARFEKVHWPDSIEYIPKVRFNDWFSAILTKSS